jgi:hypothetical protein
MWALNHRHVSRRAGIRGLAGGLVAIVGEPASLAAALHVSDGAYLFSVLAALAAGAVTLALRPAAARDDADAELPEPVAYETAST